ncbi:hypothetical protein N665_0554s0022 [Sinapis alba]|nr:hypothetical protein N665_0554s0022 [Sinapis alba]
MGKKGGEMKTRSSISDDDGSVVKSPLGFQIHAEPGTAMMNSQQSRRSMNSEAMNSPLKVTNSYDSIHSPFFLHSADHPGLTIVVHTLDGTNYNSWSIAMRISLDAKNKLSFVDGSLPRPSVDDNLFKIWSRCNSMLKSWILNVVSKEIYDSILYYQDAAEMWDDLFRRFKVNNLPRKYQLEQAVMTLKQGELDLSTYFTKKKILWEQLANTKSSVVKKCDCDQVKELLEDAETSRIIQFLMGLNDNFNNVRGQILNMKPRPGLNDIYNMLDQDESQRVLGGTQKLIQHPTVFQNQAPNVEKDLYYRSFSQLIHKPNSFFFLSSISSSLPLQCAHISLSSLLVPKYLSSAYQDGDELDKHNVPLPSHSVGKDDENDARKEEKDKEGAMVSMRESGRSSEEVVMAESSPVKLTVKEKKKLASYAHSLGDKLKFRQTLEKNELLKVKIHRTCPGTLEDMILHLEEATASVAFGKIGRTVMLYRPSPTIKGGAKSSIAQKLFKELKTMQREERELQKSVVEFRRMM